MDFWECFPHWFKYSPCKDISASPIAVIDPWKMYNLFCFFVPRHGAVHCEGLSEKIVQHTSPGRGKCPCTYLKGVFIFDTLLVIMAVFPQLLPKRLGCRVYATHVPKPTILAKIWNCTPRPNCIGIQIFGRSFSRTERKLTFPGGFHGLEVVGLKRLLTIRPDYMIWANSVVYRHQPQGCSHCVYSICKYNAGPKSVWKYTHLANNHHKPYTARISFSSKLVSIVFS